MSHAQSMLIPSSEYRPSGSPAISDATHASGRSSGSPGMLSGAEMRA
jgi:hypothetical protein